MAITSKRQKNSTPKFYRPPPPLQKKIVIQSQPNKISYSFLDSIKQGFGFGIGNSIANNVINKTFNHENKDNIEINNNKINNEINNEINKKTVLTSDEIHGLYFKCLEKNDYNSNCENILEDYNKLNK